jgi:hypothetical protein
MSTSRTREKADGELFKSTGIDDNATSNAITIDSSEMVVIGATVQGAQNAVTISSAGYVQARATGVAGYFDRIGSDGSVLEVRKDGTTVGSIKSDSGSIMLGSGDVGVYFDAASDRILPTNITTGSVRNDAIDIGGNPHRFKDLYLSGGVVFGPASASNVSSQTLDSYEEGTFTPTWASTGATFSYAARSGTYTKIGNRVDYNIYVQQTASGTLTNTLSMTGLPFTSRNSSDSYHMTSIWGSQTASSQASWGYVEPNNTIITSRITTSAVATPNFYGMANGYWVIITGTYFTS